MLDPFFLQATITEHALISMARAMENFYARLPFIVIGLIVFILFLVAGNVIRKIIIQVAIRTRMDNILGRMLGRLAAGIVMILGLLITAVIIFPNFRPADLVAGLGITSVALGFVFKDILQNFFAGILILWRKPFQVGDQVRSGEFEGTVVEITIRSTRIQTYNDTLAVIPNEDIYSNPLKVMTAYPGRRIHVKVQISYLDSIDEARRRIEQVLANNPGVRKDQPPWVYVGSLTPSWVEFDVYFWAGPFQPDVLRVTDQVLSDIKHTLDEGHFDSAYPHQVVLFHDATGSREGDVDRAAYLQMGRSSFGKTDADPT